MTTNTDGYALGSRGSDPRMSDRGWDGHRDFKPVETVKLVEGKDYEGISLGRGGRRPSGGKR